MRITLTGRRLALAAVLVLGAVAAPLAYATIAPGKAGSSSTAPAAPVAAVSPTAAQAPAAVADNPYQVFLRGSGSAPGFCTDLPLPAGQDFVLESVTFVSPTGVTEATINPFIKTSAASQDNAGTSLAIALDADGDGTRAFNLVVRPDAFAAAAVGDVHVVQLCVSGSAGTITYDAFATGQRLGTPTASTVLDFAAQSRKAATTLRWTTGAETEILGFNIWRYRGAKGVKVNRTLIRAKRSGEPDGASYRFVDRALGARRGLTYRLQLVDRTGKRTWYAAFAIASK